MTLTFYTLHVLELRAHGPLLLDERLALWLVHAAVVLVLAAVWWLVVGRGPLEAVTMAVAGGVARTAVRR